MKIQVLVSTMNKIDIIGLTKSMKINDYVVINQNTKDVKSPPDSIGPNRSYLTFNEKGLSKSRNKAIKYSEADVCAIADDDMYYEENYESLINDAYSKYPDADIIAFHVETKGSNHIKTTMAEGRIGKIKSMKLASWQITFKRSSVTNVNQSFDIRFGSGAEFFYGEDNIFLFDCIKKGLKLYYLPVKIATLHPITESTWFKGHTKENYLVGGSIYYRMSPFLCPLLIIQFAIRKRRMYGNDLNFFQVIKYMTLGAIKQVNGGGYA